MWEVEPLEHCAEIQFGTRVTRKNDAGTRFPVYGGGGATFFMDEFNRANELVVARFAMSEKCTRFVEGEFFLNDSGLTLKTKDESKLNQRFLEWQCIAKNDMIYALGRGAAQKNLNTKDFKRLQLVIPRLEEQNRIVEILDEAFAAIDKAKANIERNLTNARELFQSRLNEIFSKPSEEWAVKPLGEVCDVRTGPFGSMLHKSEYSKDGVPVVNPADIIGGLIAWNSCKRVPEEKARVLEAFLLVKRDVVIGRRGEIGRNAVFQETFPALCGTGSFIVRPNNEIDPEFLHYQLNSPIKKVELESRSSGATMKNLSSTTIKSLGIAVPSNAIQKNVVGELRNLSAICSVLEKKYREELLCLEELRRSILEQAFAGKLTAEFAEE